MLLGIDDSNIATNNLTHSINNSRNYESETFVMARVNRKQKYDYFNDVHDEQETNDVVIKRQRGSRRFLSIINPDLLSPLNDSFPELKENNVEVKWQQVVMTCNLSRKTIIPQRGNDCSEDNNGNSGDTLSEVETEIDEQDELIFPVEEIEVEIENHYDANHYHGNHQNMSCQTTLEKMEEENEYREGNYREENYDKKTPEFRFLSDSQAEEDRDLRYYQNLNYGIY